MEAQFKPKREKVRGLAKAESEGCDCEIEEPADYEDGTEAYFVYMENPKHHDEYCLYRILCKE